MEIFQAWGGQVDNQGGGIGSSLPLTKAVMGGGDSDDRRTQSRGRE